MEALENNLRQSFPDAFNAIKQTKRANKKSANHFFNLPEHLIHAYYMLRHLKIRDFKVKIQYALNYYRSIQRRLTFDLHEMETRDTVLGDQEFKPPADATRVSIKNLANESLTGAVGNSKKQQLAKAKAALEKESHPREHSESPEYSYIQNIYQKAKEQSALNDLGEDVDRVKHPLDRNKYRYRDKLRNKFISTCPVMSRYHTSFGYTTSRVSVAEEEEFERELQGHMDTSAKKFMGRSDFVEFKEDEEILVKDDFGVYIMYDCVESDMDLLKDELLLTGSYYIKRQEPLMDAEDIENASPVIDRITCLEMLMKQEAKFQYKKANLVRLYMEAYEHIVDPLEQQRFIQLITNVMAERPRLNLDSNSFEDSYKLEFDILDKRVQLLQNVIKFQIRNERKINENICDYLDRAHKYINDSLDNKWKYFRPEEINAELSRRGLERDTQKQKPKLQVSTKKIDGLNEEGKAGSTKKFSLRGSKDSPTREKSPTKHEMQELYKQK